MKGHVAIQGPARIFDRATLLEIEELRRCAWAATGEIPDFIVRQDMLSEEHDTHGMHWAAFYGGHPVAAARMCIHDEVASRPDPVALDGYEHHFLPPVAAFTRLVVHPEYQGRGLSGRFDEVRISEALRKECRCIAAVTETIARIEKLKREGFVLLGETRKRYLSYSKSYVLCKTLH